MVIHLFMLLTSCSIRFVELEDAPIIRPHAPMRKQRASTDLAETHIVDVRFLNSKIQEAQKDKSSKVSLLKLCSIILENSYSNSINEYFEINRIFHISSKERSQKF